MLYIFASEVGAGKWRTLTTHYTVWDDVRYQLEVVCRLHERRWSRMCFFAMYFNDWVANNRRFSSSKSLRGVVIVNADAKIVVFRRPYPSTLSRHGAYVPHNVRLVQNPTLTEDELIAQVGMIDGCRNPYALQHPADYSYRGSTPIPVSTYVCRGCNAVGHHFKWDCPSSTAGDERTETTGVRRALNYLPRPHGIPKTFLKKASESDSLHGAMRDKSGNVYLLKKVVPVVYGSATSQDVKPAAPATSQHVDAVTSHDVDTAMEDELARVENWYMDVVSIQLSETDETLDPLNNFSGVHVQDGATENGCGDFSFERRLHERDVVEATQTAKFYDTHPMMQVKKPTTCIHWLQGLCVKGFLQCEFLHVCTPHTMPICKFFRQGTCTNSECGFRHIAAPREICARYTAGFCPEGPRCACTHVRRSASEWPGAYTWPISSADGWSSRTGLEPTS